MNNKPTDSDSSVMAVANDPLLAVLRKWLNERLRARDLGEQECYSVGVCQQCGYRTLWSGGMTGAKLNTCAPCKVPQLHDFYSFDSANVKEHATLSARARVDHGVEVECRKGHENRAADRGCVSRLVRLVLAVVSVMVTP
jgi:hypothetical protein